MFSKFYIQVSKPNQSSSKAIWEIIKEFALKFEIDSKITQKFWTLRNSKLKLWQMDCLGMNYCILTLNWSCHWVSPNLIFFLIDYKTFSDHTHCTLVTFYTKANNIKPLCCLNTVLNRSSLKCDDKMPITQSC